MATKDEKASRKAQAQLICDRLSPLGPVFSRAMFGGHGLYLDGMIFGLIVSDELHFKSDHQSHSEFEAAGAIRWCYEGKNKPVQMPYWSFGNDITENSERLITWAEKSVSVAKRAARSSRK